MPAGCPTPEEVAAEIAKHVRATQSLPSRHVMRIIPVSHTCFVSEDDLKVLATKVAEQHFPKGRYPCTPCRPRGSLIHGIHCWVVCQSCTDIRHLTTRWWCVLSVASCIWHAVFLTKFDTNMRRLHGG
eukprot:GHUV01049509.1.p1 GENE.GHUV01049509.1~~GHUV01049509.1.p1  ORF type:complete len:128 (-),score=15.35 GHUV01049509.1:94-477(-)